MELWWPQSAWLSSGTSLFLFFNVLVGAVLVMSRGQQGGHGRRLCRSASSMVLDRLRSFSSMFPVHPAAEWDYHTTSEAGELRVDEPPSATADASAVPSVAETETDEAEGKCRPSLDERNAEGQKHRAHAEPTPAAASAAGEAEASGAVAGRAEKEQQPTKEQEPPESCCKRRAGVCRREADGVLEGKAELNARTELFIHQFREELKLQRLNSIINYTRGLRRRAGEALLPQD